jgi:ABC-type sugar transport system ATPase subunit
LDGGINVTTNPFCLTGDLLTKRFGSNTALSRVSFKVSSGEILALVGSNGSGKSTLLKTTYGTVKADSGSVSINGEMLRPGRPHETRMRGIEMVFQDKDEEAKLCPDVSVLENLFLGREPVSPLGIVLMREMQARVSEVVEHYSFPLPPLDSKIGQLSGGQQKAVAIGRALLSRPRILLLDEPTASLGLTERRFVHEAFRDLKESCVGIILCSHSLDEVMSIADRIMALRGGEVIADEPLAGIPEKDIALLMSR